MHLRRLSSLEASVSGRGPHESWRNPSRAHAAFRASAAACTHHKTAAEASISSRRGVLHLGALVLGNLWVSGAHASADQSDRKSLEVREGCHLQLLSKRCERSSAKVWPCVRVQTGRDGHARLLYMTHII